MRSGPFALSPALRSCSTRLLDWFSWPRPRAAGTLAATEPFAGLFVGVVWAVMLVVLWGYVGRYGKGVPEIDEYANILLLIGEKPLTFPELWVQHNEHHIPLPRLLYVLSIRSMDYDFKAIKYLNVLLISASALLLLLAARFARGHWSYSDACVPLTVMTVGQAHNLLWGFQVQFFISTFLASVVLTVLALSRDRLTWAGLAAIGACVVLLPGCGGNGLALNPALGTFLLVAAAWAWRESKSRALVTALVGAAAFATVPLYFLGFEHPTHHPEPVTELASIVRGSCEFFGLAFGPAAQMIDHDPTRWPLAGSVAAGLMVMTAVLVTAAVVREGDRFRALGMGAYFGAFLSLTLGLAHSRAQTPGEILAASRYITLALPLVAWAYLSWGIFAGGGVARVAQTAVFGVSCLALAPAVIEAVPFGQRKSAQGERVIQDIRAGVPRSFVVDRNLSLLYPAEMPVCRDGVRTYFDLLQGKEAGLFRELTPDPELTAEPVPVVIDRSAQMDVEGDAARSLLHWGYLTLQLPERRHVYGLRLTYTLTRGGERYAADRVSWGDGFDVAGIDSEVGLYGHLVVTENPLTANVLIDDEIDHLTFQFFQPGTEIRLTKLEILTPVPRDAR